MRPIKTTLFIGYCMMAVVLVGSAFSHVWRANRLLNNEKTPVLTHKSSFSNDTASLKILPTDHHES